MQSSNRRRLNTSPSVDARVSELFKVLDAAPSNSVCKACSQKVKKLLKLESSVTNILSTLKGTIQALAQTAMTQPPSAQRAKRASISSHSHLPSNRLALEDSCLTP